MSETQIIGSREAQILAALIENDARKLTFQHLAAPVEGSIVNDDGLEFEVQRTSVNTGQGLP